MEDDCGVGEDAEGHDAISPASRNSVTMDSPCHHSRQRLAKAGDMPNHALGCSLSHEYILLIEPILDRYVAQAERRQKDWSAKEVEALLLKLRKEILGCLK